MSVSTLARSLPTSVVRRWRGFRWPARLGLISLAVALPLISWNFSRERPDPWPARMSFDVPEKNYPLAFSPDGRTFLSTGQDGIVPWDTGTGRKGTPWAMKQGLFVRKGAYSPDGRTFAAAIYHPQLSSIELIDATTGRTKATLPTQHPLLFDMAFADDGRTLRAVLGDSRILKESATWDVATGQQTASRPITAPTRASNTAFSPDGRMLAFIQRGGTAVLLWDLEADVTLGRLANPTRAGNPIGRGLDFSPDGRTLAVGRDDGAIDLWDVPARKLLKTLPAHPSGYVSQMIRFAPDGRTLASSGHEVRLNSLLHDIQDHVGQLLIGPPRSAIAMTVVVEIATGQRVSRTSSFYYPMYTPDSQSLMTRREDLKIRFCDLADSPR